MRNRRQSTAERKSWMQLRGAWGLRHQRVNDLPRNIRQPEITSVVPVGQLLVVETQQGQDGGVQIMNVHLVFDCCTAKLAGGAVDGATFDAAPGQNGAEGFGVVVPAGIIISVAVADGLAAELPAPNHQ